VPKRRRRQPTPQTGLGAAVRVLREEAKLTQLRLALKAGVSSSWLSRIEGGKVDPTWGTMRQLAKALGVSMEALAERAEGFEGPVGNEHRRRGASRPSKA
jgi:transcriptional regulator with XRE-family HTH domain